MDISPFLHVLQDWGPSAISGVLFVVVLFLVKMEQKHSKEDGERAAHLQKQLDAKIKEFQDGISKALIDHGRRISYIEMEYVKRDTFYRELSGWKEDMNRVLNKIDNLGTDFTTRIIELYRGGK